MKGKARRKEDRHNSSLVLMLLVVVSGYSNIPAKPRTIQTSFLACLILLRCLITRHSPFSMLRPPLLCRVDAFHAAPRSDQFELLTSTSSISRPRSLPSFPSRGCIWPSLCLALTGTTIHNQWHRCKTSDRASELESLHVKLQWCWNLGWRRFLWQVSWSTIFLLEWQILRARR